jgi:hypothetical protein
MFFWLRARSLIPMWTRVLRSPRGFFAFGSDDMQNVGMAKQESAVIRHQHRRRLIGTLS